MSSAKERLRELLWLTGYDVVRFTPISHRTARKRAFLRDQRIDTIIDVGANTGQFATKVRKERQFRGDIASFEPLSAAYAKLEAAARGDPRWRCFNYALGEHDGQSTIQIAGNSVSSSILPMLETHVAAAPASANVGEQSITVRRLDSVIGEACEPHARIHLKIDTQGYESHVIAGAAGCLDRIVSVEAEMSIVPLYEGESLMSEFCRLLRDKGFMLVDLEREFMDPRSGEWLQVNGTFARR